MKPLRAFQQAFDSPAPYRFAVIARTRLILSFDAVAPNGRRRPHYQRKSAGTVTVLRFASVIIRHKAAGKRKQVGLVVFTHPFECVIIGILIVIVRLFANGLEHLFFGKRYDPFTPTVLRGDSSMAMPGRTAKSSDCVRVRGSDEREKSPVL